MDLSPEVRDLISRTAASYPWGPQRRRYMADTVTSLGLGQRQAQQLFGWGRDTIRKALHEWRTGVTCQDATSCRGRKPAEFHLPHLLDDLRDLVQDQVQTDPTFQTTRLFCRLTAAEVRRQLLERKGYTPEQLPSIQTLTVKLNALGFRLRKVAKCRPQKKCRKPTRSSRG
jgi:transposase